MITQEALIADDLPTPSGPSYIAGMAKTYNAGDILFQKGT